MEKRETWGSKIGFILAAAGSSIGLGNIWRFPYLAGQNGGAIFVVVYLLAVLIIGLPVMLAEISLGRATGKNPVGAFQAIRPKGPWKLVGYLGVLTGLMILSYYSVVSGWITGYLYKAVTGKFSNITVEESQVSFGNFTAAQVLQILLTGLFIFFTAAIIYKGVSKGIERMAKILMPALFVILLLLVVWSLTLKGASQGLSFYLEPDFSKINATIIIKALGQAFFSLSLGLGAMMTYGSYMKKKESIPSAAGWVVLLDTSAALLAGFMIFPAIFSVPGMNPAEGPGLVFNVLPVIFSKIPLGIIVGPVFFVLLAIAALTSTISMLEVVVAYFCDERKWNRKTATIVFSFITFLVAIPSAISGKFFGLWDFIWGNLSLTIGALFIAIFVGYVWKTSNALEEIKQGAGSFKLARLWVICLKYVSPLILVLLLVNIIFKIV